MKAKIQVTKTYQKENGKKVTNFTTNWTKYIIFQKYQRIQNLSKRFLQFVEEMDNAMTQLQHPPPQQEVIIIEEEGVNVRKPAYKKPKTIPPEIVDDPELLLAIQKEEVSIDEFIFRSLQGYLGKVELFICKWEEFARKTCYDQDIDVQDVRRDFHSTLEFIGPIKLTQEFHDNPIQLQMLKIYLNYQ